MGGFSALPSEQAHCLSSTKLYRPAVPGYATLVGEKFSSHHPFLQVLPELYRRLVLEVVKASLPVTTLLFDFGSRGLCRSHGWRSGEPTFAPQFNWACQRDTPWSSTFKTPLSYLPSLPTKSMSLTEDPLANSRLGGAMSEPHLPISMASTRCSTSIALSRPWRNSICDSAQAHFSSIQGALRISQTQPVCQSLAALPRTGNW